MHLTVAGFLGADLSAVALSAEVEAVAKAAYPLELHTAVLFLESSEENARVISQR